MNDVLFYIDVSWYFRNKHNNNVTHAVSYSAGDGASQPDLPFIPIPTPLISMAAPLSPVAAAPTHVAFLPYLGDEGSIVQALPIFTLFEGLFTNINFSAAYYHIQEENN